MKIAIIGYSGSGKSTLTKILGEKYSCPVLHLDKVNFEPNWKERDRNECIKLVDNFMKNKSWIIDGNYTNFLQEKRFEEADRIVFLNFPRRVSFFQAYKRYLENKNKTREDMTEGCIEKFDLEFIKWLLIDGRAPQYKNYYNDICKRYREKIFICKNRKDVEKFIREY